MSAAREKYLSLFESPRHARSFECWAMSGPPELLPPAARRVKNGMPRDESFWRWLVEERTKHGKNRA